MDVKRFLRECCETLGPSGQEERVAAYLADQFRPLVDEVRYDAMFSVLAHKKGNGPRVMLCAHLDEIALMVTHIEDDGSLCVGSVGVDPRILPACRVWVHGKEKLFGTIGAMPPHLLSAADRSKSVKINQVHVDVGLPVEKVRELVHVGDPVTFYARPLELLNGEVSGKSLDDRACVAFVLRTAERLQ